ncbi:serine/threonine-protein kinase [Streptomyces sp. NPDC050560]|uniref:serine/threonine-protein kinase n=1 Tax=Streptomyces sp. NPDC050560 TaxID=3365630 RepID=UPI0037B27D37
MGRYHLEERLGRGGMGIVWRATDQLLGRQVAVKELDLEEGLDRDEIRLRRERLLREGRAVAGLGHQHIVVVHDIVPWGERPYIVMELVEGGSLADLIARRGPVEVREAARIGAALLDALHAAHSAGVLHRDLKPANVLLEADTGRVVLTDFGIAQVAGAATLTETGSFVGSPEYTAPERMSGEISGPSSDLWSLGALLCAATSGTSPFHRDSLGGVLLAVVSGEIRVPEQAAPLFPVIQGLLERDPARRLGAETAERMLRTFAETGRMPSTPSDRTPRGGRPGGRLRGRVRALRRVCGAGRSKAPADTGATHRLRGARRLAARRPGRFAAPAACASYPVGALARTVRGPQHALRRAAARPVRAALVAGALVVALVAAGVSSSMLLRGQGGGLPPATPGAVTVTLLP